MKRKLSFALSLMAIVLSVSAQDSDLSTMSDAVYVKSLSVTAGSEHILSVCMKNSIDVQTIQFDLYLPEGLTIVANQDDELMTASKERIKRFNYFESSAQSDGALRLLAQATSANIAAGDGEIAKVIVNIDKNIVLGEYPLVVKNIILVSKDNESKKADAVSTTITIVEYDETTGMQTAGSITNNDEFYDLQGHRTATPVQGINIVNGKKTLIK